MLAGISLIHFPEKLPNHENQAKMGQLLGKEDREGDQGRFNFAPISSANQHPTNVQSAFSSPVIG